MRRQCAQNVQDYQKPLKNNRFSPSPIKRYHSSRSFIFNDNKENIGSTTVSRIPTKRFKRLPLQISQLNQQEDNNISKLISDTTCGKMILKSDQPILEGISEESFQQKKNMDFENQITTSNTKKREEKFERKRNEFELKAEKNALDTDSQASFTRVQIDKEDSSKKEQGPYISIKTEKESDSLMEGTDQSGNSAPLEMQYQGRWTSEEHLKFVEGLKMFGKDWRKIEEYIGSRTCAQIRSHAQKYFNRLEREVSRGITQVKAQPEIQVKEPVPKIKKLNEVAQVVQSTRNPQKEIPLQVQTNQQIKQIHDTLSKLTEDDLVINLKSLIAQREYIASEVLMHKIIPEAACEKLIGITNKFHQLAMQALQSYKFEICNRMIDERNLTQFICILFSKQILITPAASNTEGQEIIQHVKLSPAKIQERRDSDFHQHSHDRETAKSSPMQYSLQYMDLKADDESFENEHPKDQKINKQ